MLIILKGLQFAGSIHGDSSHTMVAFFRGVQGGGVAPIDWVWCDIRKDLLTLSTVLVMRFCVVHCSLLKLVRCVYLSIG